MAVISPEALLQSASSDQTASVELFHLRRQAPPERIAGAAPSPEAGTLRLSRPVFTFGQVFSLLVSAGPEFRQLYPARQGMAAALLGLLLTTAGTAAYAMSRRRREKLEHLVDERTASLRESEARFTKAFEESAIGMAIVSLDGRWTKVNRQVCEMFGHSASEMTGLTIQDVTHPDDLEACISRHQALLKGQSTSYKLEKRYLHKSGRILWAVLHNSLVRDGHDRPLYFVCQIENITAAKQLETIQRFLSQHSWSAQGEDFFSALARFLAETLDMNYVLIDRLESDRQTAAMMAFYANGKLEKPMTYSLQGAPCAETIKTGFCCVPQDVCKQYPEDADLQTLQAESYIGIALPDSRGNPIGLIALADRKPLADPEQAEAALRQVAIRAGGELERQLAEELQRHSQQRFAQVADNLNEWIWEVDVNGMYTYCSEASWKILGYMPAELVGKKYFYDFFVPEMQEPLKAGALAAFQEKQSFRDFENPNLHKDGHVVILSTSGTPILNADGKLRGYRGADTDITERKRAETALRASEARLGKMVANIADVFGILDAQGTVRYCSQNIECLFGWSPEDLVGQTAWKTVHPDDLGFAQERFAKLLGTPRSQVLVEFRYLCKNGDIRIVEMFATNLLDDPDIQGILLNFHDISERKRIEIALRASEAKLGKMIANVTDVFGILDAQGIIQYCSPNTEQLLGWLPAEVIGKNAWAMIHPDDAGRMLELFASHLKEPMSTRVSEFRSQRKDGSHCIVELTGTNLMDDPDIRGVLVTFHDITERKRAEEALRESEQTYRMLTETMKDVIWRLDPETQRFLYLSPSVEKLRGYTPAEILAEPMDAAICPPYRAAVLELFRSSLADFLAGRISSDTYFKQEIEQPCKDGSRVWAEIVAHYWRNPRTGKVEIHGVTRDIAERKQAEMGLQSYKDHLEELVALRTAELSEARDQAQAANRAKSAFLANMSHELRTPLTAVIGFAQVMSHSPSLLPQERESLGIILRSGEHLLALINAILDLSKIEAGRIELDRHDLDLVALVGDVTSMMQGRARAKGLALAVDLGPNVPRAANTDPGKFRQILINLVGNAIKFTQAGHVIVRLDAIHLVPGYLLKLEVEDSGRGIAKEELELIFQPFVQAQAKERTTEGTGLGLAITRQYVQMLGGSISVSSDLGKGSCFRLEIPVGEVGNDETKTLANRTRAVGVDSPTEGIRVLVVEDQPDNRLLLHSFLKQFDFQVREALNGEEGVAAAQEWKPHLILMDRRMPVLDGLEATRRIRALPVSGKPPVIIAVSAHTFKEEQQEMLSAGCDGFLGKPFNVSDLLTMLAHHLGLKLNHAEKTIAQSRVLAPGDLASLPLDQLNEFHELALEGQYGELVAWIEQQKTLSRESKKAIGKLIADYNFESLATTIAAAIAEKQRPTP